MSNAYDNKILRLEVFMWVHTPNLKNVRSYRRKPNQVK